MPLAVAGAFRRMWKDKKDSIVITDGPTHWLLQSDKIRGSVIRLPRKETPKHE